MLAPAKINLFLHVGRVKANGRHDLDSLVMFAGAEAADRIEARKAKEVSLALHGDFSEPELVSPENLVLRTIAACEARGLRVPKLAISLHKSIPVAAGLGGGSADAGATLRLLQRLGTLTGPVAMTIAAGLGGDVPASFLSQPCLMRGEGETVSAISGLPNVPVLLVNPGIPCPTGPVFRAFDRQPDIAALTPVTLPARLNSDSLVSWLQAETRNDLEGPAIGLVPIIGDVLETLGNMPGCHLARMSGSGATCFGIFSDRPKLRQAAESLKARQANWWIVPTLLSGSGL